MSSSLWPQLTQCRLLPFNSCCFLGVWARSGLSPGTFQSLSTFSMPFGDSLGGTDFLNFCLLEGAPCQ